jgi:catechol 2,3-dioxygenase-like lactoylglutathione lyase family enzyme
MAAVTRLARIVLTVRGSEGVAQAAHFYHQALGLPLVRLTDDWAELQLTPPSSSLHSNGTTSPPMTLHVQAVTHEAALSTGYAPILTFEVASVAETIAQCVQLGAHMDGPIQHPAHGTVAALRTPQGHMLGLYEPPSIAMPTTTKTKR